MRKVMKTLDNRHIVIASKPGEVILQFSNDTPFSYEILGQWHPNFFKARSAENIQVLLEARIINLYCNSRNTFEDLASGFRGADFGNHLF